LVRYYGPGRLGTSRDRDPMGRGSGSGPIVIPMPVTPSRMLPRPVTWSARPASGRGSHGAGGAGAGRAAARARGSAAWLEPWHGGRCDNRDSDAASAVTRTLPAVRDPGWTRRRVPRSESARGAARGGPGGHGATALAVEPWAASRDFKFRGGTRTPSRVPRAMRLACDSCAADANSVSPRGKLDLDLGRESPRARTEGER
jgi:hypothetical protein